jgi:hypothetical protein
MYIIIIIIIIIIICICICIRTHHLYTEYLQCHTWNNQVSRVWNVTAFKWLKCMKCIVASHSKRVVF